jgi:hypothetical protein
MNGLWLIWSNAGGELNRKFVPSDRSELDALFEMLREGGELNDGDTIRVELGQIED